MLLFRGYYDNGAPQGLAKIYYESGALKAEFNYINGILEGLANKFYESGKLESKESRSNGL